METSGAYTPVNGLEMYYEIHGRPSEGRPPLVLIHGGGSTIQSTFGRILPELAGTRQVIAVELQAHGHTKDINRPLSFAQDAGDAAALLKILGIKQADFFGFSNGGMSALQIAIRHPLLMNKLVLASTPYQRDGLQPGFFEGLQHATLKDLPKPLEAAYLRANPDPKGLQAMFDKDRARMLTFKDFSDADLRAIQAPTLILNGDVDVVRPESALALAHIMPRAQVAILLGGHGDYIGEVCAKSMNSKIPALVTAMIEEFLDAPSPTVQ